MKKVVTLVFLIGTTCVFLAAQNVSKQMVTGSWEGSFADSLGSGTISLSFEQQNDGSVSGTYTTTSGGAGTVSGNLNGDILKFLLTQTTNGCPGSYTGILSLGSERASATYWGNDCKGKHENGVVSVQRAVTGGKAGTASASSTEENYQVCSSMDPNRRHFPVDVYPSVEAAGKSLYSNHSKAIAKLPCGEEVTVVSQSGLWTKVRTSDGTVGYVPEFSVKKESKEVEEAIQNTRSQSREQAETPSDYLNAVAWRAQPWTTTAYYTKPGSSNTDCTGSGTWSGETWNGSTTCTSQYMPAQNIPLSWTHYAIYNLVETATSWMVLSCTSNWRFSQCRHLIPGETYVFVQTKNGQIEVIGQKKAKYDIVALRSKSSR